jgi:S1-C subfamily serine protease
VASGKIRYAFFEEDNHVVFLDQIKAGFLNEGDPVYVLGYPMGLVAPDRQYVISRFGSISRIRDLKDGYAKDFLVDATVFPGNSGGPVINGSYVSSIVGTQAPNKACLIGMVKSYIPYHDRAVSPQTGQTRVVFEENSGLSSVVPTDFIKETVDLCYKNTRAAILVNQSKKVS